jgi:hypothetical protein
VGIGGRDVVARAVLGGGAGVEESVELARHLAEIVAGERHPPAHCI